MYISGVNNYVGCFKDTAIRDLSNVLFNGKVSIEQCRELCSNYTYFGLQATNNCLCGNSYGRYGQVAESECNKPCSGNAGQICGNDWRNSVYRKKLSIYYFLECTLMEMFQAAHTETIFLNVELE
jgi:hypothetical protein